MPFSKLNIILELICDKYKSLFFILSFIFCPEVFLSILQFRGYMPPEYILEGILSTKYDVYSFGVTLLETISGMCRSEPARHHASVPWVSEILHAHTDTSVYLSHFCWNYTRKCIMCDFAILYFQV